MASHQEASWTGHDGLRLHRQSWLPDGDPRAAVIVLHGFTEHGGRYAELAERLCASGYAVHVPDLRGHGRSDGARAMVWSFDEFVADLGVLAASVRAEHAQRPLFLLGHSMGGAVVARFAMGACGKMGTGSVKLGNEPCISSSGEVPVPVFPHGLRGLVLSAPPVRIGRGLSPLLRWSTILFSRVFPRLKVVRLGTRRMSRDLTVEAQFRADPLVYHGRIPVRIGAEILRAGQQIERTASLLRLPLLILQGSGDRIVDFEGAEVLYQRAASRDRALRLYQGFYHDLFHEPEKDQIAADVIQWLDERC